MANSSSSLKDDHLMPYEREEPDCHNGHVFLTLYRGGQQITKASRWQHLQMAGQPGLEGGCPARGRSAELQSGIARRFT